MTEHKDSYGSPSSDMPPKLDAATASKMLEGVFEEAGLEPNTVPMEALASYSPSQKRRIDWRRIVAFLAVAAAVVYVTMTATPKIDVSSQGQGESGLPVYAVRVSGLLPVRNVRARLDGTPLPVKQTGEETFEVEPTANGILSVEVTITNNQHGTQEVHVSDVDDRAPVLVSSSVEGDVVSLYVKDSGTGVNYEGIYALTESREVVKPTSWDEAEGLVTFAFPAEDLDVYIPDVRGNTLHLAMELVV